MDPMMDTPSSLLPSVVDPTRLEKIIEQAVDPRNPLEFAVLAFVLSAHGYLAAKGVDFVVGDRGLLVRFLANAAALWISFVLLPWGYMSNAQTTIAGLLFSGMFFSLQSWDNKRLL